MMESAFTPVTGQGLGVSYSSLAQSGSFIPSRSLGQANIECFANVTNGNLMIKDHVSRMVEMNGPLELGLFYNTQATTADPWQFTFLKKFKQLPSDSPDAQTGILVEADGHETTYTFNPNVSPKSYCAPGLADGTPWITYDSLISRWVWHHPGTGVTEYYDPQGYLRKREDKLGRVSEFEYDAQLRPSAITAPSGARYEIVRNGQTVELRMIQGDNNTLLQQYRYDNYGRLVTTTLPGGYTVQYQYNGTTNELTKVIQSDGTVLSFNFKTIDGARKLYQIFLGDNTQDTTNRTIFDYSPQTATIKDGNNIVTTLKLDTQGRATQLIQEQGYTTKTGVDNTYYAYASAGQLATIQKPDSNIEMFKNDAISGLLIDHSKPNGQEAHCIYENDNLIVLNQSINSTTDAITRFVYDTHYGTQNKGVFLRFAISPSGRVTEYRTDAESKGNVKSKRVYLSVTYPVNKLVPTAAPSLMEMEEWAAKQNPQHISLTEYDYDERGQVIDTRNYASIDAQGNGIANAQMSNVHADWNEYGNLLQRIEQQSQNTFAITSQSYDGLQRPLVQANALNQQTMHIYDDTTQQIETVLPNGRSEITQNNTQGLAVKQQDTATVNSTQQVRDTIFERDSGGRLVVTTKPDQQKVATFSDRQNRLGYTVSPSGIVTENRYDRQNRYNTIIHYANAIDTRQLYNDPDFLPSVTDLQALIKPSEDDRYNYEFYDASGRTNYLVDASNYITQLSYDDLDHITAKISYATALTNEQLQQLKTGQSLILKPDVKKRDRYWQYFYDIDGQKIAEQDPAGYITEYKYDNGGRIVETIQYATKMEHTQTFVRPEPAAKDAHHYYFYDARSQCTLEVDAENYITTHTYLSCGLKEKDTRYANRDLEWVPNTTTPPQLPVPSTEDQVTAYEYDLLNREIQRNAPASKIIKAGYEIMGHRILQQALDAKLPPEADPWDAAYQRGTQAQYDPWEQVSAEANAFISQELVKIDNDASLTPEQKDAAKAQVWQNRSIRHIYDSTGLKLKSINSLGYVTLYYYDLDRRLKVTVNPRGAVNENTLNSFGDVSAKRAYYKPIPKETLTTLTGGFIDASFEQMLNDLKDPNDSVYAFKLNKSGQVVAQTDPEGYQSTYEYNAFHECIKENLPVNGTQPTLEIKHVFDDPRGLETETIKTADGKSLSVKRNYETFHAKETSRIDEVGCEYNTDYDHIGRIEQTHNSQANPSQIFKRDAFDRVVEEIDSLNRSTRHRYDQTQRSHTIEYPEDTAKETIIENAFNQTQTLINGQNGVQQLFYAPDGQQAVHIDELNQKTADSHNDEGWKIEHENANGSKVGYEHDEAGNLQQETKDKGHLDIKTRFSHDALNRVTQIQDPRNVLYQKDYDRRNVCTQTITDPITDENPKGLNLIEKLTVNAQKTQTSVQKGDNVNSNQYLETKNIDGFGRKIASTVDPNGLEITQTNVLNDAGKVIASIGPDINTGANTIKNPTTRYFYDLLGNKRFEVDPLGGVTEWKYNTENKEIFRRDYTNAVDPKQLSDTTTLTQIEELVRTDENDTLAWYFYDANDRQCFIINTYGAVEEIRYDHASNKIQTIRYDAGIDTANIDTITTNQLFAWTKENSDSNKNRPIYYINDAAGQQRYVIDSENAIVEQRFNSSGKVFATIAYATRVSDPAYMASLPLDQIDAHIKKNDEDDRWNYTYYDALNRKTYTVGAEGLVTQYSYDDNGNQIQECEYAQQVKMPQDYDQLAALIQSWKPDPSKDTITTREYDARNLEIKMTNALQKSEENQLDALGNLIQHIARDGGVYTYQRDRAGRVTLETSPPIKVTRVKRDTETGLLSYDQVEESIKKSAEYDKASNKTKITEAVGTPEERAVDFIFDACNQLNQTVLENILIDDPNKPASFTASPTQKVTLTTQSVYDAKGSVVAEKNEANYWSYKTHDAEKRLIYDVAITGAVTQNDYNIFNETIHTTHYKNTLPSTTLEKYKGQGIPLSAFDNLPASEEDRDTYYQRDRRGMEILVERGPIFYYLPNGLQPKSGTDYIRTKTQYNAFGESIYEAKLRDPKENIWAETIRWLDRCGKLLAESNPIYAVTYSTVNARGQETKKTEYANLLQTRPDTSWTLEYLRSQLAKIEDKDKDRNTSYEYDLLGQLTKETYIGVIRQQLIYDINLKTPPTLVDLPKQDLSKQFGYNDVGKRIAITYEDDTTEYTYFDLLGNKIAEAGIPFTNPYASDPSVKITPLTYYGVNYHNQEVMQTRFKLGTNDAGPDTVPVEIATDPGDQCTLKQADTRGLISFEQDPEQHVKAMTYSPVGQLARDFITLTSWVQLQPGTGYFGTVQHIDENRSAVDPFTRIQTKAILRDNRLIQLTQTQYNAFQEAVAEGPGDGAWPVYWKLDLAGNVWSTNSERCQDLRMWTLDGYSSARMTSTTDDLSQVEYSQLPDVITWNIVRLERTEDVLDLVGRPTERSQPAYYQTNTNSAENIPLSVLASTHYPQLGAVSLSWAAPQEKDVVKAVFEICPLQHPNQKKSCEIDMNAERWGVDVSTLPSDVYEYWISYYITDPTTHQPTVDPTYKTYGQIQFDTGITNGSQNVVPVVEAEDQLKLTGNTLGLTAVQLLQNGQLVEEIPVTPDPKTGECKVDLSTYASGQYTIKPVNNHANAVLSLPFTIYTSIPSPQPLAREISCSNLNLLILSTYAQFTWDILPESYHAQPIRLTCSYLDKEGNSRINTAEITLDTDDGQYVDDNGDEITCNFKFSAEVQEVQNIVVEMQLPTSEWIPIVGQALPLVTNSRLEEALSYPVGKFDEENENEKSSHSSDWWRLTHAAGTHWTMQVNQRMGDDPIHIDGEIATTRFQSGLTLYITSVTGFTEPPSLSFWDVTLDRKATWTEMQSNGVTSEGVTFNVTTMAAGLYPYKLSNVSKLPEHLQQNKKDLHLLAKPQLKANYPGSEKPVAFEESATDVQGALSSLDLEGAKLAAALMPLKEDPRCRDYLADEILNAFITFDMTNGKEGLAPLTAEWENLIQQCDETQHQLDYVVEGIRRLLPEDMHSRPFREIIQWLVKDEKTHLAQDLVDRHYRLYQAKVALENYCKQPDMFAYYVSVLGDARLKLGYKGALLYTQVSKDISLFIWKYDEQRPGSLKLFAHDQSPETGPDTRVVHMLHKGGFTRFNSLTVRSPQSNKMPQPTIEYSGDFAITRGDTVYNSQQILPEPDTIVRPTHRFGYDRFNNMLTETDSLDNTVTHTFSDLDLELTREEPPRSVMETNGTMTPDVKPLWTTGYGLRGQELGTRDPNNGTSGNLHNQAGYLTATVLQDGMPSTRNIYNALAQTDQHLDSRNNVTHNKFDRNNNLIEIITPLQKRTAYTYDERNRRNSTTNAEGNTWRSNHDARGFVELSFLPQGQYTQTINDRNGQPLYILYSDGHALSYQRNYFGYPVSEVDLSGTWYGFEYDFKNQLVHKYSTNAKHGEYVEVEKFTGYVTIKRSPPRHVLANMYCPKTKPTPNQNLYFNYAAGRLMAVWDYGQGTITRYGRDSEGRQVSVEISKLDGTLIRKAYSVLDCDGNEVWLRDNQMYMTIGLDRKSNKISMQSILFTTAGQLTESRYFVVDAVDRVLIDGGELINGVIQITPKQGTLLGYTDGLRTQETTYKNNGLVITILNYDPDLLLTNTRASDGTYTNRLYTPSNAQRRYEEIGPGGTKYLDNLYYPNQWVGQQEVAINGQRMTTDLYGHDAVGNPGNQYTNFWNGFTNSLLNEYVGFEERKLTYVSGIQNGPPPYSPGPIGVARELYDANGSPNAVSGVSAGINSSVSLWVTYDGQILQKSTFPTPFNGITTEVRESPQFYGQKGQLLGSCDIETGLQSARETFYMDFLRPGVSLGGQGTILGDAPQSLYSQSNVLTSQYYTLFRPMSKSVVSSYTAQKYLQTVSESFPPPVPNICIAPPGATFADIAYQNYGDSKYAGVLAEANGWSGNDVPEPGQPLFLPQLLGEHNDAQTQTPYGQLMAVMIGQIYPFLAAKQPPPPPTPKKKSGGFFKSLVSAFVAVAISIAAPGVGTAAMAFLQATGALTQAVFTAVATAALTAMGQGLMVATGIQSSFSWDAVWKAGLQAGAAYGLSSGMNAAAAAGKLGKAGAGLAKTGFSISKMIKDGSQSVMLQLFNMSTGIQDRFDFNAVAAAMGPSGSATGAHQSYQQPNSSEYGGSEYDHLGQQCDELTYDFLRCDGRSVVGHDGRSGCGDAGSELFSENGNGNQTAQ